MKIEVTPIMEIRATLSDGTALKSSSKEALIRTIKNKMQSNANIIAHNQCEINRLNYAFILLKQDLKAAEALASE